jgi:hypothetical protein
VSWMSVRLTLWAKSRLRPAAVPRFR